MVRILPREGQDVNEQTQNLKNTPLHIAAQSGHLLIVKYLLEQGAAVNLANANSLSPLELTQMTIDVVTSGALNAKGGREKQAEKHMQAV